MVRPENYSFPWPLAVSLTVMGLFGVLLIAKGFQEDSTILTGGGCIAVAWVGWQGYKAFRIRALTPNRRTWILLLIGGAVGLVLGLANEWPASIRDERGAIGVAMFIAALLFWAYYTGKTFGWRFWKWPL